ncbi:unnamed protein product [Diabrotica balteata]|uniref:DNA methyltransferase 2 n=1 Tax=Diabrotica balteata TaxID=107213 RepID=A0A9N9SQN3_DIABA|nr:unnamed protein product [Diabrotica balteata]
MNVLELYSGIGGMHLALKDSGVKGNIVASIEINNIANEIYKLNFPETYLWNANIEGITVEDIKKLNVDTILMSPPCQPFTRNGLQNDIKDPRTASFIHLLNIFPELNIKYLLVENVKGFENSEMRDMLVKVLSENDYNYQEFIVSPHQIGVPNSRNRYYCLARKYARFSFEVGHLLDSFPDHCERQECFSIEHILEENVDPKYYLSDSILIKYSNIIDICYKHSKRSCCFTKAYSRFIEGTGSVFTDKPEKEVVEVFNKIKTTELSNNSKLNLLKSLGLRFFTPREICRLMCFPDEFYFPPTIGDRKKYMVLGNSINVRVVSKLIQLLTN